MSQINLMSGGKDGSNIPKGSFFGGSFFLSFAVLAIAFGAYFGAFFYRSALQKEVDALEADNAAARDRLVGDKADRVADFSDRLTVIDENLKKTSFLPSDPFSKIERALMPDANITDYSYDIEKREVQTSLVADSFRSVAQQVIAFKKEGAFSSVMIDGEVRIGTSGKVEAKFILLL